MEDKMRSQTATIGRTIGARIIFAMFKSFEQQEPLSPSVAFFGFIFCEFSTYLTHKSFNLEKGTHDKNIEMFSNILDCLKEI